MMLKRSTTESKPTAKARLVRAGVVSLAAMAAVAALATGCLDRDVVPAEPKVSNLFVDQIVQTAVDKIDLLFMVDNSASMADKQEILADAVPVLVSRLIAPICLDGAGAPTGGTAAADGSCAMGGTAEFNPIGDIHIGIVSSSLGAHGGAQCSVPAGMVSQLDDKGHLTGSLRTTPAFSPANTWNNQGFLAWDSAGKDMPPGENVPKTLQSTFKNMIAATGEIGCGYEASLEAWYRFLIDPEPPASVSTAVVGGTTITVRSSALAQKDGKLVLDATGKPTCTGCDDVLLAQRKAFLRPDSLVAVVMLSDENDCSIRDDSVGWFVGSAGRMPLATDVCKTNPNDPCCRSCAQAEGAPPKGCVALSDDLSCKGAAANSYNTWDTLHDNPNLRCYKQHQRFGFDLLYETQRYVNGLTQKTLQLQSSPNITVTNPLFDSADSTKAPRDPSLVFLAGIVGVPWQDIADDASLTGAGLNYLTAQDLVLKDRWPVLLGTPNPANNAPPVLPSDPFMIETTDVRTGMNTIASVSTAPANSTNPKASAINGHEYNIPNLDDLQYACTFPLKTPKTCVAGDAACDCTPDKMGGTAAITTANSPLCQPTAGGAPTVQQNFAKAYPGARELQVLKDLGDNAIVASICPKVTTTAGDPAADPNYGYNPAVGAIIERLKEALKGKCLPRPIQADPTTHQVLCKVIEAQKTGCGDCTNPGRGPADPAILKAVQTQLSLSGNCGGPGQAACASWCECEILQESDANLTACQANAQGLPPGYCYIDQAAETAAGVTGAASLVAKCPPNQPQLLRFVTSTENQTPAQGAVAFIACLGAARVQVSSVAGGAAGM